MKTTKKAAAKTAKAKSTKKELKQSPAPIPPPPVAAAESAGKENPDQKKERKPAVLKRTIPVCILLATNNTGYTAITSNSFEYQWAIGRMYARRHRLGQTIEMKLICENDQQGCRLIITELLRQIRTLKLGGMLVQSVVVASPARIGYDQSIVLPFILKLNKKQIRIDWVNDEVLPGHLASLKKGLIELQRGYEAALDAWYNSIN